MSNAVCRCALVLALLVSACGTHGDDADAGAGSAANGGASGSAGQSGTTGGAGHGGNAGASGAAGGGEGGTVGTGDGSCSIGGKTYPNGASNVPAGDGCNHCSCMNGLAACTLIGCIPQGCVVAKQLDKCCNAWTPVSYADLMTKPCLAAWPATHVDQATLESCQKMSDVDCALVDCADVPPQSRVAKLNAAQQCVWADECVNNEDCVLASDRSACCACPAATPKSLLDGSSCLRAEGDTAEAPSECACSEPVFCGQCPAPQEPTCVIRDSYSLCQ